MSEDLSARREAVYTALQPFLKADTLHTAVNYWETHYGRSTGGTLHRFVTHISHWAGLSDRRAEMLTALVAATHGGTTDPARRPTRGQAGGAERQADDSQLRAFEMLVNHMLDDIDRLASEQLRTDLIMSLRSDRVSGAFLGRLRGWLLHRQQLRPVTMETAALRATVHQLYVLMAVRLGPVETDQALHRAGQRTRASDPRVAAAMAPLL